MFKKIIFFITSLLLIINSTLANAATIGAWNVSNPMAVGASILYDGSKGATTSSILITPNTSQVAKVLRGGVAGYALTLAVEQLLGVVDWVMDPANNQIKYKLNDEDIQNSEKYFYDVNNCSFSFKDTPCYGKFARTPDEACRIYTSNSSDPEHRYLVTNGSCLTFSTYWGEYLSPSPINRHINPNYIEEKTLPLETVAEKVIENAESDNLDAQFAVLAAANNILSEAENDDAKAKLIEDELENNAKCPSGIVRNGSCWICDKSQFMPITRATRDAKTSTRGKSCKNVTDTAIKTANATLFRNLINARIQENACWSPPDPNHATALLDAQNALSLCEN